MRKQKEITDANVCKHKAIPRTAVERLLVRRLDVKRRTTYQMGEAAKY